MSTQWEEALKKYIGLCQSSPTGLVWIARPSPNSRSRKGDPAITAEDKDGYYTSKFKAKNVKAHRVVFFLVHGYWPTQVDHINGNVKDNNPENLREITSLENNHNRYRKCKGYRWHKGMKKYHVRINLNYVSYDIGYFDTEQEARDAYLQAKKMYHPTVLPGYYEINDHA